MAVSKILQFKVELFDTNPLVWRRIQLKSSSTFCDLHHAIQSSMGWQDCHLHCFEIKNPLTGKIIRIERPLEDEALSLDLGCFGEDETDSWTSQLTKYNSPDLPHYLTNYTYDFGDDWIHRVTFEGMFDPEPGKSYPACIGGERACPPEDCGGPYGFHELKENLKKNPGQRTEWEKEVIEWVADRTGLPNYDPDVFDPSSVTFVNSEN